MDDILFDAAENLDGMTPMDLFVRDQRLAWKMARELKIFGKHITFTRTVVADPCAPSRILVYRSHLYAACRAFARDQGSALTLSDMNLFMVVYGCEDLFAGHEPVTPEDRVESFNLMRG
ncbi:hypothetical protein GGF32_003722 [Allomyces javanicus]|nr:hypothetical protein GGF32_003722 [Allomyces javanicus]